MVKVLDDFGFASLALKKEDFLKENYVTQLGYPPLRIDILNSISGVDFDKGYQGKVDGEVDGLKIPFINVQDFIRNKQASGREKDLGDIKALDKKSSKK